MESSGSSGGRTRGDGMENIDNTLIDMKTKTLSQSMLNDSTERKLQENNASIPGALSIYRSNEDTRNTVKLPATVPQGKLFYLVPHLVNTNRSLTLKNKEPRFIPFEPYKAAVSILTYYQPDNIV